MTFVAPNLAWGKARGGSISRSGSVTDEQRSHRPNSAHPFGRQFFFGQTSLLAPHRPLKGMLVARASSGRKIPRRALFFAGNMQTIVIGLGEKSLSSRNRRLRYYLKR